MGCGPKAVAEDEAREEYEALMERLDKFLKQDKNKLLRLFADIKQAVRNLDLEALPMARQQHTIADELVEKVNELP